MTSIRNQVKNRPCAWHYYDGLGRLAGLEAGSSGITRFVYDSEWRLLAEYDETIGNTVLLAKYVYGPEIDEPLRMERGGQKYYYHAAALGTVTEITDATGALGEQYRYDVYGEPEFRNGSGTPLTSSAIGNRLLFQGRDRDPATGLYNFRHRYYSPTLGRFLQPDPIGKPHFEATRFWPNIWFYRDLVKEAGDINLYGFCINSPTGYLDPFGLQYQTPPITLPDGTVIPGYRPPSSSGGHSTPGNFPVAAPIVPPGFKCVGFKDGAPIISISGPAAPSTPPTNPTPAKPSNPTPTTPTPTNPTPTTPTPTNPTPTTPTPTNPTPTTPIVRLN